MLLPEAAGDVTHMPSRVLVTADGVGCCVCLQVLPAGACFAAVVLGLFIIEVIGAPFNYTPFSMTAQKIVIILAALGSGACILTTLVLPHLTYRMTAKKPTMKGLKRMNYLGLVRCLPDTGLKTLLGLSCAWLTRLAELASIYCDTPA